MNEEDVEEFVDKLDYDWAKDFIRRFYGEYTRISKLYAREISTLDWQNNFSITGNTISFKVKFQFYDSEGMGESSWKYKIVKDKLGKNTLGVDWLIEPPLIDDLYIILVRRGE
ncbi:MAG: hypothetical protein QXL94_06455, partial [Candidatus Parvarchaeum sp.]